MDKNMADRLIELREKNHLSQSAVANRLGVTPALISAYEKTERNPSLERLIALADIYHTSTDYILGRTTTDSYATIIEVKDLTDAQIRILRELVEVMSTRTLLGRSVTLSFVSFVCPSSSPVSFILIPFICVICILFPLHLVFFT